MTRLLHIHEVRFRYYETGSVFEYELVRLLYGKYRDLVIAK
jgi:phospholipid-binding lipoprotein MlaA